MQKGPLIPTLSLAAGIATSAACQVPWWCGIFPIAIAVTLYSLILKASKDPVASIRFGKWHIIWVILLFAGIGVLDESLNRPLTLQNAFGRNIPETLYCEVTGIQTKTYGERIDVIIDGTNGAKARIRSGVTEISPGDIIIIPSMYLKHISSDTTKTGIRLQPMLKAKGIIYTCILNPKQIKIAGKSSGLRYFFIDIREKIEREIERSHLNKTTADFLKAILMGDKAGLDESARLTFANGGMAHMLALSGMHIGILAGLLLLLMWPIKLTGHYKLVYAAALILLWAYIAVTGMAYSSVRAGIMTTFAFTGIVAERKNYAGKALCSACLLILLADPAALFDAGFQLSVVCVGALIAFASRLNPIGHRQHPLLYNICGALIATMTATAASWVLTSYYFSQIPLMFLPSNVILLPILPIYISLAIVFLTIHCIGIETDLLGRILDHGYDLMLESTDKLSCGKEFVIDFQIPLWGVAIWMLLLGTAALALNRKRSK